MRKFVNVFVSCFLFASVAQAQNALSANRLVQKAIAHERQLLKATLAAKPLVETYLQFSANADAAPDADRYSLSELALGGLNEDLYGTGSKPGLMAMSMEIAKSVVRGDPERIDPAAFVDMLTPDPTGFSTKNYRFKSVRTSFIGSRRVAAFDVVPLKSRHDRGRFDGRICIDLHDEVIVRFAGVFESHSAMDRPEFLHFDSWRKKSSDGEWRP